MEGAESLSEEAMELELLERVFLRLGGAGTDDQLRSTLERFLVPTILKSGSEFKSVQNKVLEILTHVNKRLQSRPNVLLPMSALLTQFTNQEATPQTTNFSLVYIKLGFHRLMGEKQAELLPLLVNSLSGKRAQQQDSILKLFMPSLVHFTFPKDISRRKEVFGLDEKPEIKKLLLEFLRYFLLLPYGQLESSGSTPRAPAGFSWNLLERLSGKESLKPEELEKVKMAVLRFLGSEVFAANECALHFIIAAADPKHNVAGEGDHLLKQFGSSVDWEDSSLITDLYTLYLGTVVTPGKRPHPEASDLKDNRSPAALRLRLRLVPFLTKSTLAANSFPSAVQVIFDNLFGVVSNSKLKILSLHFVQHICSRTSELKLKVMAPVILTGLNKIINQPPEDPKLHVLSYVAIGSLAKKAPFLFIKDTKHLSKIFSNMQKEVAQDIGLAIQECLSLMAAAYRGVKGQSALIVEALILENIYSDVVMARLAAVHYAESVFPFHHVPSRFACMLACGDSKEEVREEGKKGLIPPSADNVVEWGEEERKPPDFCKMLQYLHKRATLAKESGPMYQTAAGRLPFHPYVLTEGIKFLRLCLSANAGVTTEDKLSGKSLPVLIRYLHEISNSSDMVLTKYLDLLKDSLGPAGDGDLHSVAMAALLELAAAAPPESIRATLSPDIQWVKGFTHSSRAETREPAARLFGLLAQGLKGQSFMELAEKVLRDTFDANYGVQHGGVVSLGHICAVLVDPKTQKPEESPQTLRTPSEGAVAEFMARAIKRLVDLMKLIQNTQLATSSCKAIGTIFCSGPLPLPTGIVEGRGTNEGAVTAMEVEEEGDITKATVVEEGIVTKAMVVKRLAETIRSAKQQKLKEHCVLTMGNLCLGEPAFPLKEAVMDALLDLKEEKAIELQFSVGEAMACTLAGDVCGVARDPWRIPVAGASDVTSDLESLPRALEDILTNYAVGTSPIMRQSSCIWLLSLLKHAGKHPGIQSHLKRMQMVFMDMLTEHSEVTQEVASRGMGLVYDMSEEEGRGELVEMLVGTLMEGRKSSVKVTEETKLFQEGMLGKAPKGGNLSTYKELCSLASDMNKPDLVYKFMSLANHSALWNSKKGAAYGFSTIAAQAQEQLAPYLPTIVPRLYRYKYDPSPGVQGAMTNIWAAVVPDSKRAMDRYFPEIMEDLVVNLNSALWRNRQSSCVALGDLLVSRQVGEVADRIPQLWELVLRARDDIKETVRKAADIACESLHKVTVRACDGVTMTTTGVKLVEGVLPILLKNGLTNPSDDIKAISLRSILKISKNAGVLLKPHVAVLVPTLLESLSSLEHQKLNTYSLMFSGEREVQEKLDDLRVAASRSSPMMETVQLCVQQVGPDELVPLVPRLVEVMKSGVGLATKVASTQFVVLLVHHCLHDLTPFGGKLMNALLSGLSDRNTAVRKANAKAIGHLVKVCKDATVTKMVTKLRNRYFEKDDSAIQSSAAYVFHAVSTYSLDTAKKFSSEILPLVFLAMHAKPSQEEEGESGSAAAISKWKECWDEMVPGTAAGVRLHLPELVEMVCSSLVSQVWAVKKQGAAAIATITETMGSQLRPPHLPRLLSALLDALQGRTWEGKVMLLKSLSTMCKSCAEALKTLPPSPLSTEGADPPTPLTRALVDRVAPAVISQCKKKDLSYKSAALECLGGVVGALQVDVFATAFEDVISPILEPKVKGGEESEEDEDRLTSTTAKLDLQVKAFLLLGQAWPADPSTQGVYYGKVMRLLSASLPMNNWRIQVAILSSIAAIYERLAYIPASEELEEESVVMVPALVQCIGEVKYNAVRTKALLATNNIVSYHKDTSGKELSEGAVTSLVRALQAVIDDQLLDQANAIVKTLTKSS